MQIKVGQKQMIIFLTESSAGWHFQVEAEEWPEKLAPESNFIWKGQRWCWDREILNVTEREEWYPILPSLSKTFQQQSYILILAYFGQSCDNVTCHVLHWLHGIFPCRIRWDTLDFSLQEKCLESECQTRNVGCHVTTAVSSVTFNKMCAD